METIANCTHEVVCWECNGLGWVDAMADSVNQKATNKALDAERGSGGIEIELCMPRPVNAAVHLKD